MSGFYDREDIEQEGTVKKTIVVAICMASIVFFVFLLCLYQGTKPKHNQSSDSIDNTYNAEEQSEDDFNIGKSNLKSDDLDFWDMFGTKKKDDYIEEKKDDTEGTPAVFSEQGVKPDRIDQKEENTENSDFETGDPHEGTHIALTDSNGKKTWYELQDIDKSMYSANNLKTTDNGMVKYDDGYYKSAFGMEVSSDIGAVDMTSAKGNGINFVMIRSHKRDSNTGAIIADPDFTNNLGNATKEGFFIGLTVDSQAISDTEAIEEANYAIATATPIGPKYPIAINIPDLDNEEMRISKISNVQRTSAIKAFCDQVRSYGFKPIIHATKKDFITKINVEDLAAYDIWVTDENNDSTSNSPYFTDYPYKFTMWQYNSGTNICGINGDTNLSISFVNYEQN